MEDWKVLETLSGVEGRNDRRTKNLESFKHITKAAPYFEGLDEESQKDLAQLFYNEFRFLKAGIDIDIDAKMDELAPVIKDIYLGLKEKGFTVWTSESARDSFKYGEDKTYLFNHRSLYVEGEYSKDSVLKLFEHLENYKNVVIGILVPWTYNGGKDAFFADYAVIQK